jgi:hypothetical protein
MSKARPRTTPRPKHDWETTVIFPDTHIQKRGKDRHDPIAISVALQITKDLNGGRGPDRWIQLGDFMNLESVSPHNKDLKRGAIVDAKGNLLDGRLEEDYQVADTFLEGVMDATPNAKERIILEGNHDYWLWWYRNFQIPGPLRGSPWLQIPKALNFKERNIRWIPYGSQSSYYRLGKLDIIHGDYINPYHAAKTISARGRNVIYGHCHEVQVHSITNMNGICRAWAIGCLRTLEAPFMRGRANSWSHAIAIVFTRPNGNFNVFIVDIINGQATWEGKTYTGKHIPGL